MTGGDLTQRFPVQLMIYLLKYYTALGRVGPVQAAAGRRGAAWEADEARQFETWWGEPRTAAKIRWSLQRAEACFRREAAAHPVLRQAIGNWQGLSLEDQPRVRAAVRSLPECPDEARLMDLIFAPWRSAYSAYVPAEALRKSSHIYLRCLRKSLLKLQDDPTAPAFVSQAAWRMAGRRAAAPAPAAELGGTPGGPEGLVRRLAGPGGASRGRIQAFIRHYLGPPEQPRPFAGRAQALSQLDGWLLDADAPPHALLTGPAGVGKSAVLVRWLASLQESIDRDEIEPWELVYHPISTRFGIQREADIWLSLATQLSRIQGQESAYPPTALFAREAVLACLSPESDLAATKRILIVVDGLDEAAAWQLDGGLFPDLPGQPVRILAAATPRAGADPAASWHTRLGWEAARVETIGLPGLSRPGVAKLLHLRGAPLAQFGGREAAVSRLHALTQGNPFLLERYGEQLRARAAGPLGLGDLEGLEPGLDGYLDS